MDYAKEDYRAHLEEVYHINEARKFEMLSSQEE